ncbi:MAG: protein-methionine-sulfoxide reductase catalytic subunit MsrP, partial [Chloroflexi bacterium]|nr:protein-methionine-sulfoxide reductase catalytic subunit MsrP [Chloroflexota bacterium]
ASSNVTESGIVSPITGTDELGNAITPYDAITSYNNFYEFSIAKEGIGNIARTFKFKTSPWEIEIGGLVKNPKTFDVDDLRQKFPPEERIYRMRCVEGWSMVIPWNGFPLSKLLQEVEPTPEAKYVRFEALYNPEQMPGQLSGVLPWPYVEGLRLDEAMNELTILATGIEDKPLLPQNGAPIRLVAPWKYGFKNIKSIVKIELTDQEPVSAWMFASPKEYGFYANVNPDVPHPRWPQSSERIIGELFRRQTLLFNGYGDKVAHLYRDLDLKKFF